MILPEASVINWIQNVWLYSLQLMYSKGLEANLDKKTPPTIMSFAGCQFLIETAWILLHAGGWNCTADYNICKVGRQQDRAAQLLPLCKHADQYDTIQRESWYIQGN